MKRLGILISGRGSNMVAILNEIRRGAIDAQPALVVSDRAAAPGLQKAHAFAVPTLVVAPEPGESRVDYDLRLDRALREYGVELICLAGFMRILSPQFIERWSGRVLNIHPALLPSFPGLHPQRQALQAGVKISGCTVHFVDASVDGGAILLQAAVPVLETDDETQLAARILEQEHRIYPLAVQMVASGRARYVEGKAIIEPQGSTQPPRSVFVPPA